MSLSYADSLHLESSEAKKNPSKENREKISEKTDEKNEEEDIGFNIPFQANGSILNIGMNESSD